MSSGTDTHDFADVFFWSLLQAPLLFFTKETQKKSSTSLTLPLVVRQMAAQAK